MRQDCQGDNYPPSPSLPPTILRQRLKGKKRHCMSCSSLPLLALRGLHFPCRLAQQLPLCSGPDRSANCHISRAALTVPACKCHTFYTVPIFKPLVHSYAPLKSRTATPCNVRRLVLFYLLKRRLSCITSHLLWVTCPHFFSASLHH